MTLASAVEAAYRPAATHRPVRVVRHADAETELEMVSGDPDPRLRGTVLDDQGAALQSWLFTAETTQLLPGDVVRFQSELPAPDGAASRVNVTFTNERPAAGLGY